MTSGNVVTHDVTRLRAALGVTIVPALATEQCPQDPVIKTLPVMFLVFAMCIFYKSLSTKFSARPVVRVFKGRAGSPYYKPESKVRVPIKVPGLGVSLKSYGPPP